MGLGCCLDPSSSCLGHPGLLLHLKVGKCKTPSGRLSVREERERKLGCSLHSLWSLCFSPLHPPSGYSSSWFQLLFLTLDPGPHWNVCGLGIFQWFCLCIILLISMVTPRKFSKMWASPLAQSYKQRVLVLCRQAWLCLIRWLPGLTSLKRRLKVYVSF